MRSWFGSLRAAPAAEPAGSAVGGSARSERWQTLDDAVMVPWETRAAELGARSIAAAPAIATLQTLWARDRNMAQLGNEGVARLERFLHFVRVDGGRTLIHQHELGNFMVVLITGGIAVDRRQPWGELLRLAESRPGEILGEMSLLDNGPRFSACSTLGTCEVAVLPAEGVNEMMRSDPRLAAALIALLARKLSMRLRAVNARLSDRPNQDTPHGTRPGQ